MTHDPAPGTKERSQAPEKEAPLVLEDLAMPSRREYLPDTRPSLVHKLNVSGFEGHLIVGYFEDGRPGEIFIKVAKEGSTLGGFCDAVGVLLSIALQHGVPLKTITDKLKNTHFEPSGRTKNPGIPVATSLCDYIARWLEMVFAAESEHAETALNSSSPHAPLDTTTL